MLSSWLLVVLPVVAFSAVAVADPFAAASYPEDDEFVAFTCNGDSIGDPKGDLEGASDHRDLVGNEEFPAVSRAVTSTHLYIRMRLAGDPTVAGSLRPFGWGFLMDVWPFNFPMSEDNPHSGTYDYLVLLRGNNETLYLYYNEPSETGVLNDPTRQASLLVRTWQHSLSPVWHSKVAVGTSEPGDTQYWLTIAIPWESFTDPDRDLAITPATPLVMWFATSTSTQALDKDFGCYEGRGDITLENSAGDPVRLDPDFDCEDGYFGWLCEACTCVNGTCDDGLEGSGACLPGSCAVGFSGADCDECASDHYGSDCEACSCVNGTCDDGLEGSGACHCHADWEGPACDVATGTGPELSVNSPSEGERVGSATPTFSGTSEPGAEINLYVDDELVGTAVTDADGNWSLTLDEPLPDGEHEITVSATNEEGSTEVVVHLEIDTSPPWIVIREPASGTVSRTTPDKVSGASEPGVTIDLYINGELVGSTVADEDGNWSIELDQELEDGEGEWEIEVRARDELGRVGIAVTTIVVDTVVRLRITGPAEGDTVRTDRPTLQGTGEPGAEVEIVLGEGEDEEVIDTVVVDEDGNWTWTADEEQAFEDGQVTIRVRSTVDDETQTEVVTIYVDTSSQGVFIDYPQDGETSKESRPTLGGTAEPGTVIEIYDGEELIGTTTADDNGHWSFTPEDDLADGEHTLRVVDPEGEEASIDITIDTIPPYLVVDEPASDESVSNEGFTVRGRSEPGALITVYLDGEPVGTTTADEDGYWSVDVPATEDGEVTLTVIATDPAGNNTLVELEVVVEFIAEPVLDEPSHPDDPDYGDEPDMGQEWDLGDDTQESIFGGEITGGGIGCSTAHFSVKGLLPWLLLLFATFVIRRRA